MGAPGCHAADLGRYAETWSVAVEVIGEATTSGLTGMPNVRNGSVLAHYEVRGAGPAAILFNHTSTSNLSWSERFLESLAEEFTVVTPDYRGTGLSSAVVDEFTLTDLAADGIAVLDAEKIEMAVVIGASMGGAVAQEFALHFPERVLSMVLSQAPPDLTRAEVGVFWQDDPARRRQR